MIARMAEQIAHTHNHERGSEKRKKISWMAKMKSCEKDEKHSVETFGLLKFEWTYQKTGLRINHFLKLYKIKLYL